MKDQTLLAILQQSEYHWPHFLDWYQAHHSQLPKVKPAQPTLKLKVLNFFNRLLFFLPTLARLKLALALVKLIESPFKGLIVNSAQLKLSYLRRRGLKVVAVAGSYGKTSTKTIAAQLLGRQLTVVKTKKSFNTPLGISQTIHRQLRAETELFIVELGEYYPGDIQKLSQFVKPDFGIMTPLGAQHLTRMGSLETAAQTIVELQTFFQKQPASLLIHESYQPYLKAKGNSNQSSFYGLGLKEAFHLISAHVSRAGTEFEISCQQQKLTGFTPLLGQHQIINLLPSFWLGTKLGLKLEEIKRATTSLDYIARRHQPKPLTNNVLLIDNSYNTNPQAITASLALMQTLEASNKIVITMGFVELGPESDRWHAWLGQQLAQVADYVGVIKSRWNQALAQAYFQAGGKKSHLITAENPTKALEKLNDKIIKDSLILLEGGYQEIFA